MTDYFEIAQQDSADARMIARSIAHRGMRFHAVLDRPEPIARPPALSWSWNAPAPLTDWVPAVDSVRVFSPRMADLVREHLGSRDEVEWLPASVVTSDGVVHPHEVPHFLAYPDMYDDEATEWGPSGLPTRWVLSRPTLDGLHFFARPRAAGPVIIADVLLGAMEHARLTGFDIRSVRMTD